ncbi:response regulator [Rhodopirellula halodulae]|uniref:response regulator n=1 Tax=Rhodopirellula halodulae TaxID=2894198 RepID=UPI001E335170|nr:response regulator [Rhodopirellula sp. JC737]MCC9655788.1 response regulator [Rhodopirellula sp. JC737]
MAKNILFVDDDPVLLNILTEMAKTKLDPSYEIHSADGGAAAITQSKINGDFSVVVIDMQMPEMNGIQTITELRKTMPHAVFVMLTANKELDTAIQAVNDGKVFKFLNKPCDPDQMIATIEAAQQQHNTQVSTKDLLSGTFAGTLDFMTDLIEMPDGRHLDTSRMVEAITDLSRNLSLQLGWEERIAARVFLVGIAMLNSEESKRFDQLDPTTEEHQELFRKICKTSAGMLKKIPRFDWIVDLLLVVPKAQRLNETGRRIEISALLLRVVFYWNFLTAKGLCVEATSSTIQSIMPELSDKLIRAMECLNDNHDTLCLTMVPVDELCPGMIPYEDIRISDGPKVVTGGRRLTQPMIENLRRNPEINQRHIPIVESSISSSTRSTESAVLA